MPLSFVIVIGFSLVGHVKSKLSKTAYDHNHDHESILLLFQELSNGWLRAKDEKGF